MITGEPFNFGPLSHVNKTVEDLIKELVKTWKDGQWIILDEDDNKKKESTVLKLNCDKAFDYLKWHASLSFEETVELTAEWYKAFYNNENDMYNMTVQQIYKYTELARNRGLFWTK